MLGTIIKHEFKATWKYFILIDFITLIIGVVAGVVAFGISENFDNMPDTLFLFLLFGFAGYVFAMFSASILTTVYNVIRYYKSLFTAEGYLTFTLPASTIEILSAKMIVAILWQTIMGICLCISVGFLFTGFIAYSSIHESKGILDFLRAFWDIYADIFGAKSIFSDIIYVVNIYMQLIMNLMLFFFAISIGQLWQKHKILGSIIAYFGCRVVFGIISFIISAITGTFSMLFSYTYASDRFFVKHNIISLVLSIIFSVGMYIGCILITDRKLNLD